MLCFEVNTFDFLDNNINLLIFLEKIIEQKR